MVFKFWSYILGYVLIRVEGVALEKFVNMAISRGIYLWDIALQGEERLLLKVRVNSFRPLRHVAKRLGCKIRIQEKHGLPFLLAYFQKRKMLVAGAVTCILTIYLMSSFIWFVEIQGAKEIPKEKILNVLKESGLDKGTPKWEIKTKEIEDKVSDNIQELAWIGITIKGTKAFVEVVEKKLPKAAANNKKPAHVVATKKGVIKEILVMTGEGVVKEGQMVRKGQVLISGIIMPPDPETFPKLQEDDENLEVPKPKYVHAKGIVKARVWYQTIGETKIAQIKYQRTGRSVSNLRIKIGTKEIILKGPKSVPYENYQREQKVNKLIRWRNIKFPVEVVSTTYYETKGVKLDLGYKKAKELTIKAAEKSILAKIESNAEISQKEIEELNTYDDNIVKFRVTVEAIENIGRLSYIE